MKKSSRYGQRRFLLIFIFVAGTLCLLFASQLSRAYGITDDYSFLLIYESRNVDILVNDVTAMGRPLASLLTAFFPPRRFHRHPDDHSLCWTVRPFSIGASCRRSLSSKRDSPVFGFCRRPLYFVKPRHGCIRRLGNDSHLFFCGRDVALRWHSLRSCVEAMASPLPVWGRTYPLILPSCPPFPLHLPAHRLFLLRSDLDPPTRLIGGIDPPNPFFLSPTLDSPRLPRISPDPLFRRL